jgi:hypothetical protein
MDMTVRSRVFCAAVAASFLAVVTAFSATNSTISKVTAKRWAWSSVVGWIDCRASDTNGVVVGEYVCSGFMYSPTAGWICLGNGFPTSGVYYATNSATDYGVNHDGKGHLWGYAWCPSAGWISFQWTNQDDVLAPKVDLTNGFMTGFAWGTGVGYISLSNVSTWVQTTNMIRGNDSETNGIPDAWEYTYFGSNIGALAYVDSDTDGVANADEYVAGTHPLNSNDCLKVPAMTVSGSGQIQITWPSTPARLYSIDMKTSLFDTAWINLGTNVPDAGSNTIRLVSLYTQGFFRVKAHLPLAK